MGHIIFGMMNLSLIYMAPSSSPRDPSQCDDVHDGYKCKEEISHLWGQYSPYFTVPSGISAEVPDQCQITFAQVLSRHGARDPTSGKSERYRDTIGHIQKSAKRFPGHFGFLQSYQYTLGSDQLTVFGEQEMINSGVKFYDRYHELARDSIPFIRTAGQARVLESAQNWTQGFHTARTADQEASNPKAYPYEMVIIDEGVEFNNTLSHDTCTNYETSIAEEAQKTWAAIFTQPLVKRLKRSLRDPTLTWEHVIDLMDMCPFETVASPRGTVSRFCRFFKTTEWQDYDYYQSLGKYYGFSSGNPLGPTQGVGYVNELIARLTNSPVVDHTNTNSTLDDSEETFPIDEQTNLLADFSHDNDMSRIFAALGLFNGTQPPSKTERQTPKQMGGFAASWTVPFGARAYFEKMKCYGQEEEYVRVLVNDRVIPLETCGGDNLGRCTLSKFVESLSFARSGGDWDKCFV